MVDSTPERSDLTEALGGIRDAALAADLTRLLLEGPVSPTGDEFFQEVVRLLAGAFAAPHIMVTECADHPVTKVSTLAFWSGGALADNIHYAISGTPCEAVILGDKEIFCCPERLPQIFAKAAAFGVDGFVGVKLRDSFGNTIGHLGLFVDAWPGSEAAGGGYPPGAPLLRGVARRLERELERRRAVRELERSREVYRALHEKAVELEAFKKNMFAVVVHDLRAPLTPIVGGLDWVNRRIEESPGGHLEVTHSLQRALQIAERRARYMSGLIDTLLDGEALESGRIRLECEAVHLPSLLRDVAEANEHYARECGARLVVEGDLPDIHVRTDRSRLGQALSNLVTNAAKFNRSDADDRVVLSLGRHGDLVRILVRDHGPGIPEDARPRLFQKFARVHPTDLGKKRGTGLGLSIAKAIVERLGGRIGFEPAEGGTAFYVDLPVLFEEAMEREEAAAVGRG